MSGSGWNSSEINVRRQNRQPRMEVPRRDSGVGNGTQHSAIFNKTEYIPCMQFVMTEVEIINN